MDRYRNGGAPRNFLVKRLRGAAAQKYAAGIYIEKQGPFGIQSALSRDPIYGAGASGVLARLVSCGDYIFYNQYIIIHYIIILII